MKRTIVTIASVAVCLFAFAIAGSAQRLGGYKEISKTDGAAQAAAEFAVSEQAEKTSKTIELISIFKAERQTVAGTNFRLCLKVNSEGDEGEEAAAIFVQAVVNVDLKGNKKLVSWTTSECGSDDE